MSDETKCLVHRAAAAWAGQHPPDGKPRGVVRWEDDARFFARQYAQELRAAGFEFASDWLRDEADKDCGEDQ